MECVCVYILLNRVLGAPTAQDLESCSDPQSSPNDGRLDWHLDKKMHIVTSKYWTELFALIGELFLLIVTVTLDPHAVFVKDSESC